MLSLAMRTWPFACRVRNLDILRLAGLFLAAALFTSQCHAASVPLEGILTAARPLSPLTNDLFARFASAPSEDRKFGLFILYNAKAAHFGCTTCGPFETSYRAVAEAAAKGPLGQSSTFFAIADVLHMRDSFVQMKVERVPLLAFYPAGAKGRMASIESLHFDIRQGISPDHISAFVERCTGVKVVIEKPTDHTPIIAAVAAAAIVAFAIRKFSNEIMVIASSSAVWAPICTMFVLAMTSGYMWNGIRNAQYIGHGGDSRIQYFASGFQQQFAIETQIVAALNGLCGLVVVLLIYFAPKIKETQRQRITVFALMAALLLSFSLLMSVFHIKLPGYPFNILF